MSGTYVIIFAGNIPSLALQVGITGRARRLYGRISHYFHKTFTAPNHFVY